MKRYLRAYLKNRPSFYSFIRPRELELFNENKPYKKPILDFGCGDGFFARVLFEKEMIDYGIDVNRNTIKEARQSQVYKKVLDYDGKKLPFKNGTFSTVISNCVLEHVDNLPPILKEIRRVLKKRGKFYCTVMTDSWEDYLIGGKLFGKAYLDWMKKIQKHSNLLSINDWEKEFKKAGFKIIDNTGYIDKRTSRLIEIFHFLSIDSLINYKLFKRWVIFPWGNEIWTNLFSRKIQSSIDLVNSSAIFFKLKKNNNQVE